MIQDNLEKIANFTNKGCFTVTTQDLPLSCPLPGISLWDAHPRVYLPIEKNKQAVCPYCSAFYVLLDGPEATTTNPNIIKGVDT